MSNRFRPTLVWPCLSILNSPISIRCTNDIIIPLITIYSHLRNKTNEKKRIKRKSNIEFSFPSRFLTKLQKVITIASITLSSSSSHLIITTPTNNKNANTRLQIYKFIYNPKDSTCIKISIFSRYST